MAIEDPLEEFRQKLLAGLPKEAEVTKIEFEGPEIAIYTRDPRDFSEHMDIKELAKQVRKRLVIRTDPGVRKPPDVAEEEIRKIVPEEAEITNISFNDTIGEVIIEARKPGLVIGRTGSTMDEIRHKTFWRPNVIRTPPLKSDTILKIRHALQTSSEDRKAVLRTIGRRIHRPTLYQNGFVRITTLGGFREVGRMCMLIQTAESNVIVDCGVNVGATQQAFPRFDLPEFDVSSLDAVVITHSHLDHCLPPQTPIRLANGQWKPICEIQKGDEVTSFNWDTGEFEASQCVGKTITTGHQELIEISTAYHQIQASPNHRFFTVKGLKLQEIEAQDLQSGMLLPIQPATFQEDTEIIEIDTQIHYAGKVSIPQELSLELRNIRYERNLKQKDVAKAIGVHTNTISHVENNPTYTTFTTLKNLVQFYKLNWNTLAQKYHLPILPQTLTSDLAQLVGYIQGDGHKSTDYSFKMTDSDKSLLRYYTKLIKNLFQINSFIRERKDTKTPTFTLEVNSVYLLRFLETNFSTIFSKSCEIRIPEIIKKAPKKIQQAYLRGLFDAEGSVVTGVKFCSYNSKLRRQVQFLLYQLNIPAAIHDKRNIVRFASPFAIRNFADQIGFTSPTKMKKLKNLLGTFSDKRFIYPSSLIPISSQDLAKILKEMGVLGTLHNSPRIAELPLGILDWYRRRRGYATRRTVEKLIEILLQRYDHLNNLKSIMKQDIQTVRHQLTIPRAQVAETLGLSIMQVEYREQGHLHDEATERIEDFLFNRINYIQTYIRKTVRKIEHLLSLKVRWHRIKRIRRHPNTEPLIDIEVLPNRNFVAKDIVVHNCGFVPFLAKYGYEGPVYCTAPTQDLMTMLQIDYLDVAQREGKLAPYGLKDVRNTIMHTIPLNYGEVTDIAPDVRLTLHNAGHILGSSIAHLHIGDGLYNLAYTGDFKYARSRLLEPASDRFPRLETLIMESTYGAAGDLMPSRKNSERVLVDFINRTLVRGGKALIPVLAVGRAQELMVVLEEYMRRGDLQEAPVYVDGMIIEATAIHTAHPEYLARELRDKIFHQGQNPFLAEYFTTVDGHSVRDEIIEAGPCIILATSGMLTGGPSVEYFKQLAGDSRNSIIFVSYQVEGTLGRRIQKGRRQLPMHNHGRSQVIKVELQIHTVEGFSGHSDRRQLVDYARRIQPKPERILTCHGEASKCINLASFLHRDLGQRRRTETRALQNFETIRLY